MPFAFVTPRLEISIAGTVTPYIWLRRITHRRPLLKRAGAHRFIRKKPQLSLACWKPKLRSISMPQQIRATSTGAIPRRYGSRAWRGANGFGGPDAEGERIDRYVHGVPP